MNPRFFEGIFNQSSDKAQGCRNVIATLREGLNTKKFAANQVSLKGLGLAFGVLDPYDMEGSWDRFTNSTATLDPNKVREASIYTESNPGLLTNAFQVATSALLGDMVIKGYETDGGYIGDDLVTVMPSRRRNQKIHGFTAMGGPLEVPEGHPYSETAFDEKWVTTLESKKGRIVSISQELVLFDETAQVELKCRHLGKWLRQDRERTIIRAVLDADSGSGKYVYRPSGTGTALYPVTGVNKNYIGVGNTVQGAPYDAAIPLVDWTDVDQVLQYRATQIKDDRIDGEQLPIAGLNGPQNMLLVPFAKRATAAYISGQTRGERATNAGADVTHFDENPVSGFIRGVKSSPFIDEVNTSDWLYGDFKSQFIYTEIWPVQTFIQGADSEAAFERDTGLRVKVRSYGGVSAVDTVFVTRIDGL